MNWILAAPGNFYVSMAVQRSAALLSAGLIKINLLNKRNYDSKKNKFRKREPRIEQR